jgi:hypothetical protein
VIGVHLLNDVDVSLAGGDVNSLVFLVKEQVVRVARDVQDGDLLSGFGIENKESRRVSRANKEPVVRFV